MKRNVTALLLVFCVGSLACARDLDARNLSICETPHFKIAHDINSTEVADIANLLELAYQHFNFVYTDDGFNLHAPSEKLTWYCFAAPQTFADHALAADNMNLSWLTSYYSAKTNAVTIVKPGNLQTWKTDKKLSSETSVAGVYIMPSIDNSGNELTRIMHEAAHQLAFNTGLQKQKVMYPVWVSEGLASNFENCIPTSDDNLREQRLIEIYRQDRLIPLNEFILISRMPESSSMRKDIYAQSCVFFKFLSKKHSENFRKYMSAVYGLRTGWRSRAAFHTEFVSAFGAISDINDSWQDYLKTLAADSD